MTEVKISWNMLNLSLMSQESKQKKMTEKELQELGQQLKDFYELGGYVNKWRALRFTALKGMAQGFGIFIGGTVVVALAVWFLSLFDSVPLFTRLYEVLENSKVR